MKTIFRLFSIELVTENAQLLEVASVRFADNAEIVYFDRKSGKLVLQFVTTATVEEVEFMTDEFKKEVELNGNYRLRYKVAVTE